ncbi:MAG: VWA-like domain-containing protein, partial [Pseudomonadota bacterium]
GGAGARTHSMVLILLHELSHILFRHHGRLPGNAPPLLWAIACDLTINVRLLEAYPALKAGAVFKDAWGTRPGDAERYLGQSEEHILYGLWESPAAADEAFLERLKEALDSQSGAVAEELDERGRRQDVHGHLVAPEQLARTLDDNNLEHVRAALKLPDPNDRPAFQRLAAMAEVYLTSDFDKAQELRELHPAGRTMAGAHLEEAFAEWIDNEAQGRLSWKNLLRELILGDGLRYEHSDEVPNDVYYVDPAQMGVDVPLYLGSLMPAGPEGVVVCVIDTSASISVALLNVFLAELNSIIEHECVRPNQIHIVSADTAIRADIVSFTEHELARAPEQLCLHGRGGTDITRVLNEVLSWLDTQTTFAKEECKAIVYFTDLLDRAPAREALPAVLPELLFLSPPSTAVRTFRSKVESFAAVAEIADGTVIDLCRN